MTRLLAETKIYKDPDQLSGLGRQTFFLTLSIFEGDDLFQCHFCYVFASQSSPEVLEAQPSKSKNERS